MKSKSRPTTPTWMIAIVIVAAYLALAVAMSRVVPFGAAPDERPHLDYVGYLVHYHSFPVLGEGADEQFEYHQPPLYYLLCAPVFAAVDNGVRGSDDVGRWVRLVSVLLGAVMVWAAYWALGEAFGKRSRMRLPVVACIAFLPMFVFLCASINNDNLVHLLFVIGLGIGARMAHRGPTLWMGAALGLVAGLAGLTKVVGLVLLPICLVAIWLPALRIPNMRRVAIGATGLFVVIFGLLCGPWLVRNQLVYGDPIGQKAFIQYFGHRNITPSDLMQIGWTPGDYVGKVTNYSLKSMLGVFGHMDRWLPGWTYGVFGIVLAAGVVGIVLWYVRARFDADPGELRALGLWAVAFLFVFLFFVKFNTEFFQAQARYMFPAILPIVAGIVLGVTRLLPAKKRSVAAWAIAVALCMVTIGAIASYGSLAQHM